MNMRKILFLIILVILAVGTYVVFFGKDKNILADVKCQVSNVECAWYAVHLNNGQVYFGHIANISRDIITLNEVYYVEKYQTGDRTVSESKNFAVEQAPKEIYQLIKRGDEKSLATDHTLYVNRSAVLFWEKLSVDADIVASINAVVAQNTENKKQ